MKESKESYCDPYLWVSCGDGFSIGARYSQFLSILRETPEVKYRRNIELTLFGPLWNGVMPSV